MIDYRYTFPIETREEEQLAAELRALSIETPLTILGTAGAVVIVAERALTGSEYDAVQRTVAAHVPSAEFADRREALEAISLARNSNDPFVRAARVSDTVLFTLLNDLREHQKLPRLSELQILHLIEAAAIAGAGKPR